MEKRIKPGMMKYCVIGNIVKEHVDENGVIRYGTSSFPSGRRVYISKYLWEKNGNKMVDVLGLNRFKSKYVINSIPLAWIENIRFSKTFSPRILEIMINTQEFPNMWLLHTKEDKAAAAEYAQILKRVKSGNKDAWEQYIHDFSA